MPPFSVKQAQRLTRKAASVPVEMVGESGRRYAIQRVLQDREVSSRCVYLATASNQKFILKDVPRPSFKYLQEMYDNLRGCPNLRLPRDAVSEHSVLVYQYLSDDLLSLARMDLPIAATKRILKDALRGLTALHGQDIVHTDIKADNILVDRKEEGHDMIIHQVQLADIEDAAHVPKGSDIVDLQVGNIMWRSPEAHAQGRVNKPSDMFSFGIVCIYAIVKRVIFAVGEEELAEGEEPLSIVLERQISYFADEDGLNGLLEYLDNSPWCEVFQVIRDSFNKDNPRKPFSLWKNIDPDFKDLVRGLTNFDPTKRLSAHEALAHKWFADL